MGKPVKYTVEAVEQLIEIEEYIAEVSGFPQVAWDYVDRLKEHIESIGDASRSGRTLVIEGRKLQIRVFEKKYRIIYEDQPDHVRVVNVHRVSKDWGAVVRSLRA